MPIKIDNSSAKYYQIRKERLQKKARGRYQNSSQQKKKIEKKSVNMVEKDIKIFLSMKNKNRLSIVIYYSKIS